jgi:hypothetical protein
MNEGGPCETPLTDLLRSIPADAVYQWEEEVRGFHSWSSSPIGKHCHRAADQIERAQKQLESIKALCHKHFDASDPESAYSTINAIYQHAVDLADPRSETTKGAARTAKLCRCEGDCQGHFNCRIVWNDEALAREGLQRETGKGNDRG